MTDNRPSVSAVLNVSWMWTGDERAEQEATLALRRGSSENILSTPSPPEQLWDREGEWPGQLNAERKEEEDGEAQHGSQWSSIEWKKRHSSLLGAYDTKQSDPDIPVMQNEN